MPLSINIRHLERHSIQLQGELDAAELDLEDFDELIKPRGPLGYDLEVSRESQGLLLHGSLTLPLHCECARCLRPFDQDLRLEDWYALLAWEGDERVEVRNDCVDLTPHLREDIVLALPQRPLCQPDCRGLPRAVSGGGEHTAGNPGREDGSSTWSDLDRLKF